MLNHKFSLSVIAVTVLVAGFFITREVDFLTDSGLDLNNYRVYAKVLGTNTYAPIGSLDAANCDTIGGWAYDPDTPGIQIGIHIYKDGPAGSGTFVTNTETVGLRSDINTVYGITGNHGFGIFTPASLKDGQRHLIYAHAIDSASGPNPLIANSPKVITCAAPGPNRVNGNSQISAIAGGSSLTISTSDQTAGAITSIIWNGKEFINSYDHGRELQSAEAFDELGECYNPTEAGGRYDTSKSSSIFKSIQAQGNVLTTQTDMAFWLSPGENYGRACNPNLPNSQSSAQNTTYTAGYLLDKKVTIGLPGVSDQIIKYETTFTIPKLHSIGGIQVIPGNIPSNFTNFWSYNPYSGLATPLLATPNTSGRFVDPVILSTADGKYAMGVTNRSEEHTSELQSPDHLVCRLLLEKKKTNKDR